MDGVTATVALLLQTMHHSRCLSTKLHDRPWRQGEHGGRGGTKDEFLMMPTQKLLPTGRE